ATPEDVYKALTTESTIQLWSGEKAEFNAIPGTEFSLWEGSITGINLAFEEGKKLVQQWFFGEREEKSVVTIILHPDKHGTSAELRHTNMPDEDFEDICSGWDNVYFASLQE